MSTVRVPLIDRVGQDPPCLSKASSPDTMINFDSDFHLHVDVNVTCKQTLNGFSIHFPVPLPLSVSGDGTLVGQCN